ncbi:hypothetical protein IVB22_14490 [Bradyrhizobium sp. 190]|uniref:hypothetical protein n=1 Tax=Bradyrhizobium sp. 190 TaxID=2782658 RepID=UPI001FF7814E|nr:hypothetical protein [Bradyrhizobium sp. 190]MCK1513755.1 hypothetical protein [Bradyrhizobium sp. 190]
MPGIVQLAHQRRRERVQLVGAIDDEQGRAFADMCSITADRKPTDSVSCTIRFFETRGTWHIPR